MSFSVHPNIKNENQSISALFATMDFEEDNNQFYSVVARHFKDADISDYLSQIFAEAIMEYINLNKRLPKCILFYRNICDGRPVELELKKIKSMLKTTFEDIPLTCITVSDSFDMRFESITTFQDRYSFQFVLISYNLSEIIDEFWSFLRYDFFLIDEILGCKPISGFKVLDNATQLLSISNLQKLTYRFSHFNVSESYFNFKLNTKLKFDQKIFRLAQSKTKYRNTSDLPLWISASTIN